MASLSQAFAVRVSKLNAVLFLAVCYAAGAIAFYRSYPRVPKYATPRLTAALNEPALVRIGVVDMKLVFESHPQTKKGKAVINAKRREAKTQWQRLVTTGDRKAGEDFRKRKEKELQGEAGQLRAEIVEKIQELVRNTAQQNDFDLVFDVSGNSLNAVPVVLHSQGFIDLTPEIIRQFER